MKIKIINFNKGLVLAITLIILVLTINAAKSDPISDASDRSLKVVMIYPKGDKKYLVTGTAWKWFDRYAITNKHVALGCGGSKVCIRKMVDTFGGIHNFRVVGVSPKADVAVLESDSTLPGKDPRINTSDLLKGEPLFSVGFPGGVFKVSSSCSFVDYIMLSIFDTYNHLYANCFVKGGASGSALYNGLGEVVGLVFASGVDTDDIDQSTGKARRMENVQYSVPASIFLPEAEFILRNPSVIQGAMVDINNNNN